MGPASAPGGSRALCERPTSGYDPAVEGCPHETIDDAVRRALREDVGGGDLSAALVPEGLCSVAHLVSREPAVLCGTRWFDHVFQTLDAGVCVEWRARDGDEIEARQALCRLSGPTRALLTGERTALNFLQTLSGTATSTRRHARALEGTRTKLLDTRKTIPGLRAAQKYAVRCGGGHNHRLGLYDGILIKENHISAAGSIGTAVAAARSLYPGTPIEVEVETPAELEQAIAAGADIALLDDFSLTELREAVARNAGRVRLEASGGYDLSTLREAALTGVDYISVGALSKHVRAIDLSLRFASEG
ncbi:MAG: carboxylating nicotinate-nucleotide diphosphorylase [Gammaproteobacteria bacterium]